MMKRLNIFATFVLVALLTLFHVAPSRAGTNLIFDELTIHVAAGSESVAIGGTVTVTLDVATLSTPINGVQAFMHFDSTILQLDTITPHATIGGVGWTEAVEDAAFCTGGTNDGTACTVDLDCTGGGLCVLTGDINYAVVLNSAGASTLLDHTVATLTFTALADGTTNLSFRADAAPLLTKLTVAADNTAILPNRVDSGTIAVGNVPHISNLEVFYSGRFVGAADTSREFLAVGATATQANVTNYTRGITGIRIFFDDFVTFATTPAAALSFDWTTGNGTTFSPVDNVATTVSVSSIDVGGGTTVTVVLNDNHVSRRWLRMTIDAAQVASAASAVLLDGELSGNPMVFPSGDGVPGGNAVFHLGSLTGDVDATRTTTLDDMILVRAQVNPAFPVPIDNVFDVDKDARVTLDDMILTRADVNPFFMLPLIAP